MKGIGLITDSFDDRCVNGAKLDRIKNLCDDRIDDDGFIEVCNNICNTSRFPPMPVDFSKGIDDWRKAFYYKNGFNYGSTRVEVEAISLDCNFCFDTGIIKIEHHNSDGFKKLMRCECISGANNNSLIPIWGNSLSGAYKKTQIDSTWFNPKIIENDSESGIGNKVWAKWLAWKTLILASEKYWEGMGYGK